MKTNACVQNYKVVMQRNAVVEMVCESARWNSGGGEAMWDHASCRGRQWKGRHIGTQRDKKKCKSDWIYWTDTVLCDFQFEQFLLSIFDLQHFCSTYLWFFLLMFHGYKRCIRFVCVHDFNSFFSWNQSNIHIDHSEYITHFILKWNNWLNVTIIRFIALHLIGKSWCI